MENEKLEWWKTGIVYQVYPRSFKDADNNGTGDLQGVIEQLPYLKELGVHAIWLSPIFVSPMADFGYDISDYQSIDPLFGTMDDFDLLLQQAHALKLKVILDFVPNHTSSSHPWFIESQSSRDNPKRDWYIWKDAQEDGKAPNNWLSVFGGSAWQWHEASGQYYYHAFLKEQPDLNWRNPKVQQAMFGVMRFWLDKGVDGFRVDVLWHLVKDKMLRNNPVNANYHSMQAEYEQLLPVYSTDQPEVHHIVYRMREILEEYDDRMLIGEIYLPIDKLVTYYGIEKPGAHLPFNFTLITLPWEAQRIAAAIDEYEAALPANGWPNWVLGNHDQVRIASRIGMQQSRVAAVLLLTLRGTPTIYYGDEIGMVDGIIAPSEERDPQGLRMPGKNLSRDPARTPMQWNDKPFAGFSTTASWLPVNPLYKRVNVKRQANDPFSLFVLYKRLIALRTKELALHAGSYFPLYSDDQLIAYKREAASGNSFIVVCNLSHRPRHVRLPGSSVEGEIVLSTIPESEGKMVDNNIGVLGDEAVIIEIKK